MVYVQAVGSRHLLRKNRGHRTVSHDLGQQDPQYTREDAERNTAPAQVQTPGRGEDSGCENVRVNLHMRLHC